MKMPRIIPADKANHRVRGSEVAAVCASAVILLCMLALELSAFVAVAVGAAVALVSAGLAGKVVERWQAMQNAKAGAQGIEIPYTVDRLDVIATLRGGVPVFLVLLAVAIALRFAS